MFWLLMQCPGSSLFLLCPTEELGRSECPGECLAAGWHQPPAHTESQCDQCDHSGVPGLSLDLSWCPEDVGCGEYFIGNSIGFLKSRQIELQTLCAFFMRRNDQEQYPEISRKTSRKHISSNNIQKIPFRDTWSENHPLDACTRF